MALCEIVFRLLPVSTATKTNYEVDPSLLTYPPHHVWRVATGWDLRNAQQLRSNNVGFVADFDFNQDPQAVGLVGDSYVEASMLPAADRPGAQLQAMLGGTRRVFAMGSPGSSLLDYAERIRFAHERFGLRDFVVLVEAGDLRQSLCGSGNVHSACLDSKSLQPRTERREPPGVAKRILRESALAQYLTGQLKLDPGRLLRDALARPHSMSQSVRTVAVASASSVSVPAYVDAVTETFFQRVLSRVAGLRLIIVVDGQRDPKVPLDPSLGAERKRFMTLARQHGVRVVDAETVYKRHFEGSNASLDVGPYDGHLNALGVRLLSRAIALELGAVLGLQDPMRPTRTSVEIDGISTFSFAATCNVQLAEGGPSTRNAPRELALRSFTVDSYCTDCDVASS